MKNIFRLTVVSAAIVAASLASAPSAHAAATKPSKPKPAPTHRAGDSVKQISAGSQDSAGQ